MSEQLENAAQSQQPEETTPIADTADQPASPEAGQDQNRINLPEPVTIKSVAEAYIDHLTLGKTKPSTIRVYDKSLQLALAYFGADRRIDSILVPHVGKFFSSNMANFQENGKPKAEATKKQIRRVFRQMMEFAQTYHLICKLPIPNSELQHARQKQAPIEAEATEITEPETTTQN